MMKLPCYRYGQESVVSVSDFAVVYKAVRMKDLASVIVKVKDVKKLEAAGRPDYRKESHVVQNTVHPNIVRAVYGYYDEESRFFLLETEYCRGGTLWGLMAWMRKSDLRFSEDEIWQLFAQLASALDYLHRTNTHIGITGHLNLRPENVLLTENGIAKLSGFGYCATRDELELFKTPNPGQAYRAPEVVSFTSSPTTHDGYTEKADIWSLGCLIYELCTFRRMENEPVTSLTPVPENLQIPGYANELLILIKACLAANPRERISAELLMASPPIQAAHKKVTTIINENRKWSGLVLEMQREMKSKAV